MSDYEKNIKCKRLFDEAKRKAKVKIDALCDGGFEDYKGERMWIREEWRLELREAEDHQEQVAL